MPSWWKRISTEDQWSKEVALSPTQLAERLSAFIQPDDPDSISFAEASMRPRKPLVGKLDGSGFRVRERFAWVGGNRHHPVAWALFTPTSKGTSVHCHFPGTGTVRAIFLCVLIPLLVFFVAMGSYTLCKNEELGSFMLFATGLSSLVPGMFYWSFRSSVGELKDEIQEAIRRSVHGPARRSHPRR